MRDSPSCSCADPLPRPSRPRAAVLPVPAPDRGAGSVSGGGWRGPMVSLASRTRTCPVPYSPNQGATAISGPTLACLLTLSCWQRRRACWDRQLRAVTSGRLAEPSAAEVAAADGAPQPRRGAGPAGEGRAPRLSFMQRGRGEGTTWYPCAHTGAFILGDRMLSHPWAQRLLEFPAHHYWSFKCRTENQTKIHRNISLYTVSDVW